MAVVLAVNADECLLTRMQEMSLDYHFTVEQEVGSATHAFFGFNGKPNFQYLLLVFSLKRLYYIRFQRPDKQVIRTLTIDFVIRKHSV